ncbi:hypothetical protein [Enterococcus olivae]
MTIFLLILTAGILLFLGITLLKQNLFYSLIEKNEDNRRFLQIYGWTYVTLAIISGLLTLTEQTYMILVFVAVMMFVSALFSVQFSKKMR